MGWLYYHRKASWGPIPRKMFFSLLPLYLKIDIKAGVSKLHVMIKCQKDLAARRLFAAVVVLISLFFSLFSQPRLPKWTPSYKTDTYMCHPSSPLSLLCLIA